MMFSIKPANILLALALITGLNATATPRQVIANVDQCSVVHNDPSDRLGNTFTIHVSNVHPNSESTICGHSAETITSSANSFSVHVNGKINCHTTIIGSSITMALDTTLDQQSPSVQRDALVNGIIASFGTAGVTFDPEVCNLVNIPV